jgi:transcriptional regulator with XRE-family HTH domain
MDMATSMPTTDAWFGNKEASTGSSFLTFVPHYALVASLLAGTGGFIDDLYVLQHYQKDNKVMSCPLQVCTYTRTPTEDIGRIREIFSPSVSDLAKVFGVSRQAIYNWLNGEQPISTHIDKLHDFAIVADMFAESSMPMTGALLKRKIIDGKSILEIIQEGGSAQDAALLLKQIVQHEMSQREMLSTRFSGRKTSLHSADADLIAENDAV